VALRMGLLLFTQEFIPESGKWRPDPGDLTPYM
jgi:hypothetical protein